MMNRARTGFLAASVLLAACFLVAGCRVQTEKSSNGEDKNVNIATPFGGIHVASNQTDAADVGLPLYPGAKPAASDDQGNQSANVDMSFGKWKLRVKAAGYTTPDSQDKVMAFYRKALGSYGDVIECTGHQAVGVPAKTSAGLTCEDSTSVKDDAKHPAAADDTGLQLKAGSSRHQHIVAFRKGDAGLTQFSLIALDLPGGKQESN